MTDYLDENGGLRDQCVGEHNPTDPRCDFAPQQRPVLTLIQGGRK